MSAAVTASPDAPSEGLTLLHGLKLWRRANPDRSRATLRAYRYTLRKLARHGLRLVADATPSRVFEWLTGREASPGTKSTELAALLSVLSTLERADLFPFETLRKIRRLKPRAVRRKRFAARFLADEEVERLCLAASRSTRPESELAIRVGVLAGLRAGEIARLRWEDVDLGRRPLLRVRRGKTGARVVPVCGELRAILAPLRRASGWIFAQEVGEPRGRGRPPRRARKSVKTLRRELEVARDEAGLPDVTWHVLRHTFASRLVQANTSLAKVAHFMGNSPEIVARNYAALLASYDSAIENAGRRKRLARAPRVPRASAGLRTSTAERRRARVLSGKWQGGSAPFGYRLEDGVLVVDPAEAVTVRLAFAEMVRTGSASAVSDELNARGLRTRARARFWPAQVAFILRNPVCTGRVRLGREVLVGVHERIVDEATFTKTQELLRAARAT